MNYLDSELLSKANEEAVYNIYIYLARRHPPSEGQTFRSIVDNLASVCTPKEDHSLAILKSAVRSNKKLADSHLTAFTTSENGLTACVFTKPDGRISVVFKGTGSGEWIDNGEGLSGICEENAYIAYNRNGEELYRKSYACDYASDQQAEALNWFMKIAAMNGWTNNDEITISGHSKGGNKAQYVAINSGLASCCYSFDGHGFSPEAVTALKNRYGLYFEKRCKNIMSFSAENDYVNVLGERLCPKENIFYLRSVGGIHAMHALLDKNAQFYPQCGQGMLSKYIEGVSNQIMNMPPEIRQYATLGVMNIFQKHLGRGTPVNGDYVSIGKTIIGISIAVAHMLLQLSTS